MRKKINTKKQASTFFLKLLLVVVFSLAILISYSPEAFSQNIALEETGDSASCGQNSIPYSARYGYGPGAYEVFVKLGTPGSGAQTTLYFQSSSTGACEIIGQVDASGDSWQKIGDWSAVDQPGQLSLFSPAITGLPDANRPTVMLISKDNPVCQPKEECVVDVGGRSGVVVAAGTLLNEDTLHLVKATNTNNDQIVSVDYYVDYKPAYSTSALEPFNLRYVGTGVHKLSTVINYDSRQKVIITETIDRGYADGFNHIFFSYLYTQQTSIKIFSALALICFLAWLGLLILRAVYKRRSWKSHHFADTRNTQTNNPNDDNAHAQAHHYIEQDTQLKQTIKLSSYFLLIAGVALATIILVNSFGLKIFQVDGPSMESTLSTGENLVINKLGKTWSSISRKNYLPKRGEIVVFSKLENETFLLNNFGNNYVVKRVIGLPGERVTVKDGEIRIFNDDHPDGYNPDASSRWEKNIHKSTGDNIDITLGPEEVFVVGDNRPESIDSRSYGGVKLDQIVGNLIFRVSPFDLANQL